MSKTDQVETKNIQEDEFLQTQVVVSVELKHPMQWGKRQISFLDITTSGLDGIHLDNGVLCIHTDVEGLAENFPIGNVVKWRVDCHLVMVMPGYKVDNCKYTPYTYPGRLDGYLGSYSNNDGNCIGFLDSNIQIVMMEDLKA